LEALISVLLFGMAVVILLCIEWVGGLKGLEEGVRLNIRLNSIQLFHEVTALYR
jgi:hypothetical protein